MSEAKVRFSVDEIRLAKNAEWILTKNEVIRKVCSFFGLLAEQMRSQVHLFHDHAFIPYETGAKISRGEKYQGLPYVVLDYPKAFSKENVFAIRTLFWWGNYFSISLHLKGIYREERLENIIRYFDKLASRGFYICISNDEWTHEINEAGYQKIDQVDINWFRECVQQKSFCKLSAKIELDNWEQAGDLLLSHFQLILQALEN